MGIVLTKDLVSGICQELKKQGKTIVFTHGAFDLFHVGHAEFLKYSKRLGDFLVVGVESDARISSYKGVTGPVMGLDIRCDHIITNDKVDLCLPIDFSLDLTNNFFYELYRNLDPSVICYGKNFHYIAELSRRRTMFPEIEFEVIEHKYDKVLSTTKIIKKIQAIPQTYAKKPQQKK